MKNKILFYSFFIIQFFTFNSYSQLIDTAENKGKYYYDSEEYMLAIPLFSKSIACNRTDNMSLQYRGNCYLKLGQTEKAIADFLEAIKLKESSELIFTLGDAYEKMNMPDSAIYYFNQFNKLEPKLWNGYARLCVIYMYSHPEWQDTAIYFGSQAVKADPKNPVTMNFLAMAYYSAGHFRSALETAKLGLAEDSSYYLLNQTAGISSFFLKDYSSAILYFDRAYRANPSDFTLLDYKIQSLLLLNTNPEKISIVSGKRIVFKEISSENLKKVEEKINVPDGNYSYKKLLQKLRSAPSTMSLDEYFMLYYGATFQTSYTPFHKTIAVKTKKDGSIAQAGAIEDALINNPTDFPLYLDLADLYQVSGNEEKYFENRLRYFGFIEGIKASGDGLSPESSIIVNDLSHENSIFISLGIHPKSQNQVKLKKHNFDVITGSDADIKDKVLYFNTDRPFSTLPKNRAN